MSSVCIIVSLKLIVYDVMADNILLFKQMLPVHSTGLEKEIKRISGKEIRLPSYKQV